jgi:hypothetical protein
VGVLQTVPGHENDFATLKLFAVVIFTLEYAVRLVGAGADPAFARPGAGGLAARARYAASFNSVVDLLAIVPFCVAGYDPHGWVDQHDEYFRMLRLCRLLKLDNHVPSSFLVDDVLRLKRKILTVASFAAATLWVMFSAAMYTVERGRRTRLGRRSPPCGRRGVASQGTRTGRGSRARCRTRPGTWLTGRPAEPGRRRQRRRRGRRVRACLSL